MFEIFVVFSAPSRQPLVYFLLLQVENQFAEAWNWPEIAICGGPEGQNTFS